MADSLLFPSGNYTLVTKELDYPDCRGTLKYREYRMVPYCSKPLFADFQSMNVYVPESFDGAEINTADSPILICNHVAGYSPWNARTDGAPGGPGVDDEGRRPPAPKPGEKRGPMNEPGTRPGKYDRAFLLDYELSRGLVVVRPGVRGKSNRFDNGIYFGKAPAALVDLKAAVRYIRHNSGVFPGNTEKIFSDGGSAGGALSAALGASAGNPFFEPYLSEIGAADESDEILGTLCHCPIMDLNHADGAYEWMFGKVPTKDGLVDQEKSAELISIYADYLSEIKLQGRNGFGVITADNLAEYMLREYMYPSAEKYLKEEASPEEREAYLSENAWVSWDGEHVSFKFEDFVNHIGRMKKLCSFDGGDEMKVFGDSQHDSRHFTDFGARLDDHEGKADPEARTLADMMNPMYHVYSGNPGCSRNWYICVGTKDSNTAHAVSVTFATMLENHGMNVETNYMWDYGHRLDDDPVELTDWIFRISENI